MVSDYIWVLKNKNFRQFFCYALIGLLANFFGYALYLILTYFWGAPKLTMTALYFFGALFGFFANRRFTFRDSGRIRPSFFRYLYVQIFGYVLNLSLLVVFVDFLGFAHQVIQAAAIVIVAIFLFLMARFFIFSQKPG